jgi:hypothetical protein
MDQAMNMFSNEGLLSGDISLGCESSASSFEWPTVVSLSKAVATLRP